MKRFFALMLMAAVAVIAMTSCKETLPARFDKFVGYVEKRCDKFSEDDWKKANAQFEKLVDEYRRTKGFDYSKEPTDLSSFSDAKIMTGLLIEDEEMIKKLGYRNYWQKKPASVVLGMNVLSKDQDSSFAIITAVLNGL